MNKKLLFKFIAISFGILLSLFLSELITRIYFFGGAAFSYEKTNSFGILDNSGIIRYSDSDELTYELIPNLDTYYKLVDFQTNNEGFRDRNHELNSNAKKVAVLGDSFTMGTGVASAEAYVPLAEKMVHQATTDITYEFFNFGVSGYTLTNYNTILKRNVLPYQPDLVIIGFCASNDQYEIGKDFSMSNFTIKPKRNVFWDSYLKKLVQLKFNFKKPEPISYTNEQLEYIETQFQEFQTTLEEHDIQGAILYLDLVYDSKRVSQLKTIAARNALLFIDTSKHFQNKDIHEYIVNELDPHPNGKANKIFADNLSTFILAGQRELFSHEK